MSEARFTRGEWFVEKDANWNEDCWAISVKRDDDASIHHCFAEVVYKMEHEDCNPELEANAHLIAAAPEMYELLQRWSDSVDCIPDNYQDAIQQETLEILAKARGETA